MINNEYNNAFSSIDDCLPDVKRKDYYSNSEMNDSNLVNLSLLARGSFN
jgi:hypothetical protein